MKLVTPTILALTIPTMTEGYNFGYSPFRFSTALRPGRRCGPGVGLVSPSDIARARQDITEARRAAKSAFRKSFQQYSPPYQITDNDEKFEVSVDVPGVKSEDVSVNLEEDGKVLVLSGSRAKTKDGYSYSSKFSQSFYLDPAIDTEKFSANLQNGVLIVSAPKDFQRIEDAVKSIPITELESDPVEVEGIENETSIEDVPIAEADAENATPTLEEEGNDEESPAPEGNTGSEPSDK